MQGSEPAGRIYAHVHAAARYGERGQHAKAHGHVLRARSLSTSFGFNPFGGGWWGSKGAEPQVQEREGSNRQWDDYKESIKIRDIPGVATEAHFAAIPPHQTYEAKPIKLTGVATEADYAALPRRTPQEQSQWDQAYKERNRLKRFG